MEEQSDRRDVQGRAANDKAERTQALFETMPIGVVYQAADGHIISANPAAERILGMTLDQLQGRTSVDPRWRAVHEDGTDFPGEEHPAMVALRTGEPINGVLMGVFSSASDEQRWIRVDAVPLFDPGQTTPREVYATFLDITDERAARQSHLESELRFRRLFDSMAEGVAYHQMLFDEDDEPLDYIFLSVNPAFEEQTGLREVTGRRVSEVIPTIRQEAAEMLQTYGRVARTGVPSSMDVRIESLDRWFHVKVFRPEPGHFAAVFENVTETRRALAALRRSEADLSTLIDSIPDVTFAIDRDYRLVAANAAFAAAILATQGKPIARGELVLAPEYPEDFKALWRGYYDRALAGEDFEVYTSVPLDDGVHHVENFLHPMRDESGVVDGVVVLSRDVTERRRAEEEILRLNADLERRVEERTAELEAANAELQGFVYSISHDLRTPLRTIGSYGQILLQDHGAALDADASDALRRITLANARMVRLVDGLLELSGLASSNMQRERVDVSRLAREIADEIREAQPGRAVEVTVADGLTAMADEALLRIVLYDLLGNAWKFTAARDPAHIEVGAHEMDGETAFFIRDDGAGFDQRYAAKLFVAFERLHDDTEFPGTGIGLATVKRIVERHGGRVWAEGEVGRGATFSFTLG